MMIRTAKVLLLSGVAFFYTLVVFNNLTDYGSNAQFVRHVLLMDTTLPGNQGMWRAISSPVADTAFYISIIAWEMATGGSALVGCAASSPRAASAGGGLQFPEISGRGRDRTFAADVAGGIPFSWRRVVPDVAVEDLERPGNGLQKLCRIWHRTVDFDTAGRGRTDLTAPAEKGDAGRDEAGLRWPGADCPVLARVQWN